MSKPSSISCILILAPLLMSIIFCAKHNSNVAMNFPGDILYLVALFLDRTTLVISPYIIKCFQEHALGHDQCLEEYIPSKASVIDKFVMIY
jgi:hypothetical protein